MFGFVSIFNFHHSFPTFLRVKLLSSETKKKEKKKKKTCFQVTRIELGWQYCNISHTMGPRLVTSLITTLPLLPPTVIFISHPNQLFSTYLGLHFPLFSSPKPTTTTPSHSRLAQALLIYLVDVKKKKKKTQAFLFWSVQATPFPVVMTARNEEEKDKASTCCRSLFSA